VLAAGAMVLLMMGAWRGDQSTAALSGFAMMLLILAGVLILLMPADKTVAFGGSFVVDGFSRYLKLLVLVGSIGVVLLSVEFLRDLQRRKFEYPILILLATTGMLMLISAADLIALYLGFELMSLSLYVMAAIDRDNPADQGGPLLSSARSPPASRSTAPPDLRLPAP
jgi:NADH-quinone oxidoreductase subunit N